MATQTSTVEDGLPSRSALLGAVGSSMRRVAAAKENCQLGSVVGYEFYGCSNLVGFGLGLILIAVRRFPVLLLQPDVHMGVLTYSSLDP